MRYQIEFVALVLDYLAQVEGLTDADRERIAAGVTDELGRDADRFHVLYPLGPESLCFRYDYPHPTTHTLYDFEFVIDAHFDTVATRVVESVSNPRQVLNWPTRSRAGEQILHTSHVGQEPRKQGTFS